MCFLSYATCLTAHTSIIICFKLAHLTVGTLLFSACFNHNASVASFCLPAFHSARSWLQSKSQRCLFSHHLVSEQYIQKSLLLNSTLTWLETWTSLLIFLAYYIPFWTPYICKKIVIGIYIHLFVECTESLQPPEVDSYDSIETVSLPGSARGLRKPRLGKLGSNKRKKSKGIFYSS